MRGFFEDFSCFSSAFPPSSSVSPGPSDQGLQAVATATIRTTPVRTAAQTGKPMPTRAAKKKPPDMPPNE